MFILGYFQPNEGAFEELECQLCSEGFYCPNNGTDVQAEKCIVSFIVVLCLEMFVVLSNCLVLFYIDSLDISVHRVQLKELLTNVLKALLALKSLKTFKVACLVLTKTNRVKLLVKNVKQVTNTF